MKYFFHRVLVLLWKWEEWKSHNWTMWANYKFQMRYFLHWKYVKDIRRISTNFKQDMPNHQLTMVWHFQYLHISIFWPSAKSAGTYMLSLKLVKIDISCETFVELNYFSMLGCHAYCIIFIWNIIGLLENMSMGGASALCQFIKGAAGWWKSLGV